MKYFFFSLLFSWLLFPVFAQKPPLDFYAYDKWEHIEEGSISISKNGEFALYKIANSSATKSVTVVQSIPKMWRLVLPYASNAQLTNDNQHLIFINNLDSLCIINLNDTSKTYISNISSYKLANDSLGEWIAYQRKDTLGNLVLHNLINNNEIIAPRVSYFTFFQKGKKLLFLNQLNERSKDYFLNCIDLQTNTTAIIWRGTRADNFILSKNDNSFVFRCYNDNELLGSYSFWYYKVGSTDKALLLADENSTISSLGLTIFNIKGFSKDNKRLFVTLHELPIVKSKDPVRLNVWTYSDTIMQSRQIQQAKDEPIRSYAGVLFLNDHRVLRLSFENESNLFQGVDKDYGWLTKNYTAENWNRISDSTFIVCTVDGARNYVPNFSSAGISPQGNYIVYYDTQRKNYFSYETKSGQIRNITKNVPTSWAATNRIIDSKSTLAPAGWIENGNSVLLYDTYDIWQVDLTGRIQALNLTNGYGRRHNIVYRLIDRNYEHIISETSFIASAFNKITKDNGFFKVAIDHQQNPELLIMGPYTFYAPQKNGLSEGAGIPPIKAANASAYLLTRMSSTASNNIYYTSNFKDFKQLSDCKSESTYNWMKSELLSWKNWDGKMAQGILYKPENFDPQKKYPVIFYFYELLSDNLNAFISPKPSDGTLNIPWYVSNGYLVIEPDIYSHSNNRFESSLETIMSATRYISSFSFVDRKRIGVQAFSWGAIQVNYILTHTNIFAAACSASGISDLISYYGTLHHGGFSGIDNFGASRPPYEEPNWYIMHSSVINVHRIETPLLMFETTNDVACPFSQGIELFTSLRRLGKKVWMLEYEDGNHGVVGKSAIDFSIRMSQFFDYYLKDTPAPKWMIEGISARSKGVNDGLELENIGVRVRPNLLTKDEQEKANKLRKRKPISITIK